MSIAHKTRLLAAALTVSAAAFAAAPASAAILDFTDTANHSYTGTFLGVGYTITTTPAGSLTFNVPQDGSTCGGHGLACEGDGLGIVDDEVSAGKEVLTITFDKAIMITGLYFLDLFTSVDESEREAGTVHYDGGSLGFIADLAEKPNGTSGFLFVNLAHSPITTSFLSFVVDVGNDSIGIGDYAVAAVSSVPLPPAALLFGGALAGLGFLSRRKKAA